MVVGSKTGSEADPLKRAYEELKESFNLNYFPSFVYTAQPISTDGPMRGSRLELIVDDDNNSKLTIDYFPEQEKLRARYFSRTQPPFSSPFKRVSGGDNPRPAGILECLKSAFKLIKSTGHYEIEVGFDMVDSNDAYELARYTIKFLKGA